MVTSSVTPGASGAASLKYHNARSREVHTRMELSGQHEKLASQWDMNGADQMRQEMLSERSMILRQLQSMEQGVNPPPRLQVHTSSGKQPQVKTTNPTPKTELNISTKRSKRQDTERELKSPPSKTVSVANQESTRQKSSNRLHNRSSRKRMTTTENASANVTASKHHTKEDKKV